MKEKNESKEQIARIRQMEQKLAMSSAAIKRLSSALVKYDAVKEAISVLNEYYGSEQWRKDYADDEAGLLPASLKRGVLSEDGIWNLLTDWQELNSLLSETASTINESKSS